MTISEQAPCPPPVAALPESLSERIRRRDMAAPLNMVHTFGACTILVRCACGPSEAESFSAVPERRATTRRIEAQNAAIARAMASICNDEPVCFGVQGGHG